MNNIQIENKTVGKGFPTLIIAEVGVNHNGKLSRGYELIDAAKEAGADVVKFQTYKAKQIVTKKAPRYWNDNLNDDKGGTQYDTFSKLDSLELQDYINLKAYCKEKGIIFCSTPFNLPDVDLLEKVGVEVYKISSSDITYTQLLEKVAKTNKPIILSTGCASISEISESVKKIQSCGNLKIILQHCILQYPCDDENANLVKMQKIQEIFQDIPVGYSDHTIGIAIPIGSVAMGACSVEKHFTIDKKLPNSPDHKLSVDTEELKQMIEFIRKIEKSKGSFVDGHYEVENKAFEFARKSLVANVDIAFGEVITENMLTAKRPGNGIPPEFADFLIGRTARKNILEDETITKDMI